MTADASLGPLFTDIYEITMAAGYHASGAAVSFNSGLTARQP